MSPLDYQLSMQLFYPIVTHFPSPPNMVKKQKCPNLAMHSMDDV